jgi:flagellar hook protein FlgE
VTFSANTLTDAAAGTQTESFVSSGTPQQAGTFSTPVTVYDALGGTHVLTATFTKTASNTWNYALTIPATDVGQTGNPVTVTSGTMTFDGNGQLTSPTGSLPIAIDNLADGASNMSLSWNLSNSAGAGLLTQVSGPSSTYSTQTDGYSSGSLQNFSVDSNGIIQGEFSNGATLALGQLALASFTNSQGLLKTGSNSYIASLSSGQPTIGTPNAGGLGTVTGGSLEQSNVDIATEFSNLILAQRDYQANAQTVTTLDQVSQYAINMIQNG